MALGDKINQIKKKKLIEERHHREEVLKLNRSLELKVEQRTQDIRSMLDNLKIGIFTNNEEGKLSRCFGPQISWNGLHLCVFTSSYLGSLCRIVPSLPNFALPPSTTHSVLIVWLNRSMKGFSQA